MLYTPEGIPIKTTVDNTTAAQVDDINYDNDDDDNNLTFSVSELGVSFDSNSKIIGERAGSNQWTDLLQDEVNFSWGFSGSKSSFPDDSSPEEWSDTRVSFILRAKY